MRARRWAVAVGVLVHVLAVGGAVAAQTPDPAPPGVPTMTVDRSSVRPGEQVLVTLTGWPGRVVTVSVCGNQALRGSQDCNMVASEAESLTRDGTPSIAMLPISVPPIHCPCVLRGSGPANDIVAFVPIELIGHPTGPLIEPEGFEPLQLSVQAAAADTGIVSRIRSALGGPTPYDVTVKVQNRAGEPVSGVTVSGAVGRSVDRDNAGIEFSAAGDLAGGAEWTDTARVVVPAPAVGSFVLTASTAGGGESVTATDSIRRVPLLMIVTIALFVGDVTAIWMRRRAKRRAEDDADEDDADLDETMVGAPFGGVPAGAL